MIAIICIQCNHQQELQDRFNMNEYKEEETICEECRTKPLNKREDKLLKAIFGEQNEDG
jgi:hypothetical protein